METIALDLMYRTCQEMNEKAILCNVAEGVCNVAEEARDVTGHQ